MADAYPMPQSRKVLAFKRLALRWLGPDALHMGHM